ncbi:RrF2 family transcriptional regulator [Lyngbya confervoides]|uniref:RrF2 family transcriptional regulator n=1 Tax=Lyngbya confervoides BDU141951 TaxID=1574623 RepID=A0ABD4T8C3_9CYAN|nr:RrF2 family transcriptional regulator [Lyngbya confervoides]MCM1984535.1 RrF2 family transcriptional regulator [Lyngbya confervoides BDU141951]
MKLSRKGQYSVKAMLDLSLQPGYGPASVRAIAQRQDLPAPYLEKLLIQLRRANLVISVRGSQGGYRLAKPPQAISLGSILEAVGESIEMLSDFDRHAAEDWVTALVWERLNRKVRDFVFTLTLEDLYFDARSRQASQGDQTTFII